MARKSLYPPSVQPGIPRRGTKPQGWTETTFGNVLLVVKRHAELADDMQYKLVYAKRSRGGIMEREILYGKQIKTKTQFYIHTGDFLIARRQIIHGACGIVPPHLDKSIVSNEYSTIRVTDSIDLNYLKYYSHSQYFQQTCFHSSVGVDVEKMIFRIEDWMKYKIFLPPLPEQKKIAEILSTWDRAIMQTGKLIDAKQRLKKGLMQQLLTGRMRFPEFGKPASEKGEIPKGWKYEKLEKILAKIVGGGTPSKENSSYWNGSIPWATVKDVSNGNKDGTIDYITEEGLNYSSTNLIPKGTNIVVTRMAVGSTIRYNCDVAINQDLKALFPNQKIVDDYLYWVLKYKSNLLSSLGNGSTVSGIRLDDLKGINVKYPSIKEQRKIAETLLATDHEIVLLKKKVDALKLQKKGLMQKLLTGEIRVNTSTVPSAVTPN